MTELTILDGNILDQNVDVIVNSWNRNIIPWWLLLPQGVSGSIKRKGGIRPFLEVAKAGPIPLGGAVLTSAGDLRFKAIIHVAGINLLWRASEKSISLSVHSAMKIVNKHDFSSVAFPVIGAGSGGFKTEKALEIMKKSFMSIDSKSDVYIIRFRK